MEPPLRKQIINPTIEQRIPANEFPQNFNQQTLGLPSLVQDPTVLHQHAGQQPGTFLPQPLVYIVPNYTPGATPQNIMPPFGMNHVPRGQENPGMPLITNPHTPHMSLVFLQQPPTTNYLPAGYFPMNNTYIMPIQGSYPTTHSTPIISNQSLHAGYPQPLSVVSERAPNNGINSPFLAENFNSNRVPSYQFSANGNGVGQNQINPMQVFPSSHVWNSSGPTQVNQLSTQNYSKII